MNISFDKKNRYLALSLLLILIGIKTNPVILLLGIFAGIKGFLELKNNQWIFLLQPLDFLFLVIPFWWSYSDLFLSILDVLKWYSQNQLY